VTSIVRFIVANDQVSLTL